MEKTSLKIPHFYSTF